MGTPTAGLEGVIAGESEICYIDGYAGVLSYRGYNIHTLADNASFDADGRVAAAGWAGGYGRQVRLWHEGGLMTTYSHMSEIAASPGSFVRRGQLIGYVGSSGLSTGPHLHYEVLKDGTPVNPLGVRFASAPAVDTHLADAVKARLKALLSVGIKRS